MNVARDVNFTVEDPIVDGQLSEKPTDGLLFAVGYEERSSFIPKKLGRPRLGCLGLRFGTREVGSFDENLGWSRDFMGSEPARADGELEARSAIREWLRGLSAKSAGRELHISVDVSSLSRLLIGVIIAECNLLANSGTVVRVRLLYTPAVFLPPDPGGGPVVTFGSVVDELTGLGDALPRGLALAIGLGYEPEMGMAAYQSFDPTETWLISPSGYESEYDVAVGQANHSLASLVERDQILHYDVMRPFESFVLMESLVSGLSRDSSVVLLPFGPKIFAAAMMLVGLMYAPDVGVWRVSGEGLGPIVDRKSSGLMTGLDVVFGTGG